MNKSSAGYIGEDGKISLPQNIAKLLTKEDRDYLHRLQSEIELGITNKRRFEALIKASREYDALRTAHEQIKKGTYKIIDFLESFRKQNTISSSNEEESSLNPESGL
jgi:hypothetical protein